MAFGLRSFGFKVYFDHLVLVGLVRNFTNYLLQDRGYTRVLFAQVDEIVAPSPDKYPGGLRQYIHKFVADRRACTRVEALSYGTMFLLRHPTMKLCQSWLKGNITRGLCCMTSLCWLISHCTGRLASTRPKSLCHKVQISNCSTCSSWNMQQPKSAKNRR